MTHDMVRSLYPISFKQPRGTSMKDSIPSLLRAAVPFVFVAAIAAAATPVRADAATPALPQMGFNNWNSTQCGEQFNETMIRGIADKVIELGLKDAGYQYINIDDCWANWQRDSQGNLKPNPERFPSGIKALADYIHSKGLRFGLYSSAGTWTCEPMKQNRGFPGGLGHESQDAALFASWGVDYLKYDNCNNQKVDARQRYTAMGEACAEAAGRSSSACANGVRTSPGSGPGSRPGMPANSWRTTGDISDNYASMLKIFKENVSARTATPGPGTGTIRTCSRSVMAG
jgi:alpha-galactosidase